MGSGGAYHAIAVVNDTDEFLWWETGLLGERIPLEVENVTVRNLNGSCNDCPFTKTDPNRIAFTEGNYSISFDGSIHNNHFITEFDEPTTVRLYFPQGLDVRNPFLGSVSRGGEVTTSNDSSISIQWNDTLLAECRFYEPGRVMLLSTFFTFWIVAAIILLFPYLLMRRRH